MSEEHKGFTFKAPGKPEAFWVGLPHAVSVEQIQTHMSQAVAQSVLPDKSPFQLPMVNLFSFEVESKNDQPGFKVSPNETALEEQAVRWCQALAALPPKSLPRSQRPIVKLLQRLPENPTGNPAIDQGRHLVLANTVKSLWPSLIQAIEVELSKV